MARRRAEVAPRILTNSKTLNVMRGNVGFVEDATPRFLISARCLIYDNGSILLVREEKEDTLETPGGTLKGSETIQDCAIREVLEETGFAVELVRVIAIVRHYDHRGNVLSITYLAKLVKKAREQGKNIKEMRWVDKEGVKALIKEGVVDWHDREPFRLFVEGKIQ